MSYPPPPPPPAGKKVSPLVWILLGVGGVFFLGLLAVGIGGYLFVHKVKQVAGGNPASVIRMIASMNPDVEVLSSDEGSGRITIRNKKDGKVVTLNFEDVKNGKISFQEDGKDAVSIQANGKDGQGTVEVKSAEGTAVFGAGSGRVPAWVPAYPGSSPQGHFSKKGVEGESGSYSFRTKDSVEKVAQYYQDALKGAGFELNTAAAGGGTSVMSAKKDGDRKTVVLTLSGDGGETTASVVFAEKN